MDIREREHRYSHDTDRCVCGGVVVWHEDGDAAGYIGEGCEVGGVWSTFTRCGVCGESFRPDTDPTAYTGSDERGEFVKPDGHSVIAHAECGLDEGWELA